MVNGEVKTHETSMRYDLGLGNVLEVSGGFRNGIGFLAVSIYTRHGSLP